MGVAGRNRRWHRFTLPVADLAATLTRPYAADGGYFAAHFHGGRLYILDANVSARSAPPGQFQQNLQIVDEEGVRVRYTDEGERMIRTDDLQDALGGPILGGPIYEGASDTPVGQVGQ